MKTCIQNILCLLLLIYIVHLMFFEKREYFNQPSIQIRSGFFISNTDNKQIIFFENEFPKGCTSVVTTPEGNGRGISYSVLDVNKKGFTCNRDNDIGGENKVYYIATGN